MTALRLFAALAIALPVLAACATPPEFAGDGGSDRPGWTGRTQVVGNNSTVAGNAAATYLQQKWGIGRQR